VNRQERRAAKRRNQSTDDYPPCRFSIEESESSPTSVNIFVVFNGMKIARRGYPDSPQAKTMGFA
jgi:hypothetical protein